MTTKTAAQVLEGLDALMEGRATRLTREAILNAQDQETEDVLVPQWNGYVTIRSMTGTERDKYEASLVSYQRDAQGRPQVKSIELDNLRARLISLVAIDEKGARLFTTADVLTLGAQNATALDLLFPAAPMLSRLTAPAREAAKDALGNAPSGELGSDSPDTLG